MIAIDQATAEMAHTILEANRRAADGIAAAYADTPAAPATAFLVAFAILLTSLAGSMGIPVSEAVEAGKCLMTGTALRGTIH